MVFFPVLGLHVTMVGGAEFAASEAAARAALQFFLAAGIETGDQAGSNFFKEAAGNGEGG